jgi:hypothetical protein
MNKLDGKTNWKTNWSTISNDLPSKNFSSMQLFLAMMGPTFCGLFSNIICRSWHAKARFSGLDLNKLTNNSHWWWEVIDLMPAIVLQSHSRASDRPPDVINDQITDSSLFKRDILILAELPSPFSSHLGSDKNKYTILFSKVSICQIPPVKRPQKTNSCIKSI